MSVFKPRILKSDNDYNEAMDRISELMELCPEVGSKELDELEMISLFIEDYESKNYKVNKPSAIDAIKFRMEQEGLSQKDMEQYLGSRSKVSEVLRGRRKLSMAMITKLHYELCIPLEILIQKPEDIDNNAEENIYTSSHKTIERNSSTHFLVKNVSGTVSPMVDSFANAAALFNDFSNNNHGATYR